MKHILLTALAAMALAGGAQAATLSYSAYASYTLADGTTDDFNTSSSVSPGMFPLEGAAVALSLPATGEGEAEAVARANANTREMSLELKARKNIGLQDSAHFSRGNVQHSGLYTAVGDGEVTVSLDLSGAFSIITDRADAGVPLLANFYGGIEVDTPNGTSEDAVSNLFADSPFFGEKSGSFDEFLSVTFDVLDGDAFNIFALTSAATGEAALNEAFFDARVTMSALFNIETTGTGIIIGGTDTVPAPVPLPAALPLLLSGFGGLVLARRRRAA